MGKKREENCIAAISSSHHKQKCESLESVTNESIENTAIKITDIFGCLWQQHAHSIGMGRSFQM